MLVTCSQLPPSHGVTELVGSNKDTSYLSTPPEVSHVGYIRFCVDAWSSITSNPTILIWVQGFSIPFIKRPHVPYTTGNQSKRSHGLAAHIQELLSIGAVSQVPFLNNQFVSPTFLVPKPGGKSRFILNLKSLNLSVLAPHFKLDDHRALMRLLPTNFYAVVLDIRDAYYALSMAEDDRRFLCFDYNNSRYQFNCLCFGLACAPWAFTKLIRPAVAALRKKNIMCVNYLDDFCFFAKTPVECSASAAQAITLLQSLGFNINFEKSVLQPSQVFRFLGFIFDSKNRTISLPMDKVGKLRLAINKLLGMRSPTIRQAAKVIGLLISAVPAIPYSLIYCRRLEHDRYSALLQANDNYSGPFTLSAAAADDLAWWLQAINSPTNKFPSDSYDYELFSDASSTGWGGHFFPHSACGWWSEDQLPLHINEKELLAVRETLRHFASEWFAKTILLRVDNVTAISCINRGGSVRFPHLHNVALEISKF